MYLSEETISEIRAKASISEVIGHYIPVFKKGRNYVAKCPFHDDHDPSLSISEDKQIYKCFVCGEGGNVFTFVERYKDVSFIEAVKEVADIIGYPLDLKIEKKAPKPLKYQRYYDLLSEVIKFSSYLLFAKGGQKALAYLEGRGLSKEVIEYFDIGYNPLRNVMREYLKKLGYSDEEMIKTNVVRLNQRGEYDDVFYGRILFPIHDENAHAIAFSGRELRVAALQPQDRAIDYISFPTEEAPYSLRMSSLDHSLELAIPCESASGALYIDLLSLLGSAAAEMEKYPSAVDGYLILLEGAEIHHMEINAFLLKFFHYVLTPVVFSAGDRR